EGVDEVRIYRQGSRQRCFVAAVEMLVAREVQVRTGAVRIQSQCFFKKRYRITVSVFLSEQLSSAELRVEIAGISLDCRTIHIVRVLVSFEMDQRTRDQRQLGRSVRVFLGVKTDESLVDRLCTIFLADEVEQFGATQVACEF